jgi:hypothetical protein
MFSQNSLINSGRVFFTKKAKSFNILPQTDSGISRLLLHLFLLELLWCDLNFFRSLLIYPYLFLCHGQTVELHIAKKMHSKGCLTSSKTRGRSLCWNVNKLENLTDPNNPLCSSFFHPLTPRGSKKELV